jgi:hypothetical protein
MFLKPFKLLLLLLLIGCEYERIAGPNDKCENESLELLIDSVQDTPCGESNGEIVVSVNGDNEYEYRINDADFTQNNVFTGLSTGTYIIQARNINSNCLSEQVEVRVNNEDGIQISVVSKSDAECGENTGSITVAQEGGVEPIEYVLNNSQSQNEPNFTGLSNGKYNILAIDASGCEAEIFGIEILSDISFSIDVKPIIANNCAVSGCHNGTQSPNFSDDNNIFQNASRIKNRTSARTMPPAGRPDLTEEEIQAIACWVDDGALDN